MDINDDIINLIQRGYLNEAWTLISDNSYDLDLPRLLSESLAMAGYLSNQDNLPLIRNKEYMDIAGAIASFDVDVDEYIIYALERRDLAILEFLINRDYADICHVIDIAYDIEGTESMVSTLEAEYDTYDCFGEDDE